MFITVRLKVEGDSSRANLLLLGLGELLSSIRLGLDEDTLLSDNRLLPLFGSSLFCFALGEEKYSSRDILFFGGLECACPPPFTVVVPLLVFGVAVLIKGDDDDLPMETLLGTRL